MSEHLALKWGTLKGWELNSDGPAMAAMERYHAIGEHVMSAAMQRDTPEQKQALCDVIDALDAETVYLDWDGEYISKDAAKRYVMEYRR